VAVFHCQVPCTVGPGHTFTLTQSGKQPYLAVAAFNTANDTKDQTAAGGCSYATTCQYGAITPTTPNSLIVSVTTNVTGNATTPNMAWTEGFLSGRPFFGRGGTGSVEGNLNFAYRLQADTAASNPRWRFRSNGDVSRGVNVNFRDDQ